MGRTRSALCDAHSEPVEFGVDDIRGLGAPVITVNSAESLSLDDLIVYTEDLQINCRPDSGLATELGHFLVERYIQRLRGVENTDAYMLESQSDEVSGFTTYNHNRYFQIKVGGRNVAVPRAFSVTHEGWTDVYAAGMVIGKDSWRYVKKTSRARVSGLMKLPQAQGLVPSYACIMPSDVFLRIRDNPPARPKLEGFLKNDRNALLVLSAKSTSLDSLAKNIWLARKKEDTVHYWTSSRFGFLDDKEAANRVLDEYRVRFGEIHSRLQKLVPEINKGAGKSSMRRQLQDIRDNPGKYQRRLYVHTKSVLGFAAHLSARDQIAFARQVLYAVPMPSRGRIQQMRQTVYQQRIMPSVFLGGLLGFLNEEWNSFGAHPRPKDLKELKQRLRDYVSETTSLGRSQDRNRTLDRKRLPGSYGPGDRKRH